jgi:hypothetical protein
MASPTNLPSGTALTGTNATQWADSILGAIGAPVSGSNVSTLTDWFAMEGGGGSNNPLNTTLSAAGATGSINSSGVKNYGTPAQGIAATAQTLQGFPAIVAALKTGSGLVGIDNATVAAELKAWSGGGYSAIGGKAGAAPAGGAAGTTTTPSTGTGGSATAGYTVPPLTGTGGTQLTAYNPLNPFETIDNIWKDLTGISGAVTDIPSALGMMVQVVRDIGAALTWLETAVEWFFVPSHWVRVACGAGGVITGVPGMYALMKAGQGSGDVSLALGILLTTISAVLWFIAFHNIPNDVTDLQQLLGWMSTGITSGQGTYAGDTGGAGTGGPPPGVSSFQ